jgi:hypothetical protein
MPSYHIELDVILAYDIEADNQTAATLLAIDAACANRLERAYIPMDIDRKNVLYAGENPTQLFPFDSDKDRSHAAQPG